MVLVDLGIEPGRRPVMADLCDKTESDKDIQNAIHRSARNAGDLPSHLVVGLVGGRMILTLEDRLEYGPTLHGERQPVFAAYLLQLLDLL